MTVEQSKCGRIVLNITFYQIIEAFLC